MKKDVNFNNKKKMKVTITFKKLKSMDLKTVGNVSSEQSLSFDKLPDRKQECWFNRPETNRSKPRH